jgi:hypothetical protein
MEEFTFSTRDEFNRKSIAEKAISLLKSDIDVSPMIIDGGWGAGKTEFCHKLMNLMKDGDTHQLIYIDAFKADHADEPLLTILAEVLNLVPSSEQQTKIIKKIIPAIRYGIKASLKAGVSHLLRQDAADVVDDFDKEIQQAADKAIDSSVESMLDDHMNADKSLKALQDVLNEISAGKPIIIFVDELDRCKPSFAIDMLEVIKHVFDIGSVQFVLITNTEQLKASVEHCYGEHVDSHRYLDKFIKFRFSLPIQVKRNSHYYSSTSDLHLKLMIDSDNILPAMLVKGGPITDFISKLVKVNNLSLRETETLYRYMCIFQTISSIDAFSKDNYLGYSALRVLAVFIFCFKPKLILDVEHDKLRIDDIAVLLGVSGIPRINSKRPEISELILTMISRDTLINSLGYKESLEDLDSWNQFINQGCMSGGVDENECSVILKDAFKALALAE